MTKKKSTKRALISSLLILAMCFTMLAGTTFAWFSDSAASGDNQIVAGKLQIGVYGGADYNTSIDQLADLFVAPANTQKGLWEPGHVEVAYLKVENLGTLALKYMVTASTSGEVVGQNAAGEDIKLSEILDVAVVESDSAIAYATREDALAAVTTTSKLGQLSGVSEYSLAVGASKYVAVIVSMATTVGNEANYRSDAIPSIKFAVTVLATQDTVENDSFDNFYDVAAAADFTAATQAELTTAIADAQDGDVIALTDDIDVTSPIAIDKDVTINLNGKELGSNAGTAMTVKNNGSLTIENGELNVTDEAFRVNTGGELTIAKDAKVHSDNDSIVFATTGAVVNIEGEVSSSGTEYAPVMTNGNDDTVVINIRGKVISSSDIAIYFPNGDTLNVFEGAEIIGKTGIEIRAGKLNVYGGYIEGTGTPTTVQPNGNGSTTLGAGIAVVQHNTKLPITVNISGGTIKGYTALYESNPQNNSDADLAQITINVTGGTFEAINGGTNEFGIEDAAKITYNNALV